MSIVHLGNPAHTIMDVDHYPAGNGHIQYGQKQNNGFFHGVKLGNDMHSANSLQAIMANTVTININ